MEPKPEEKKIPKTIVTLFPKVGGPIHYDNVSKAEVLQHNLVQFSNTVNGQTYQVTSNLQFLICSPIPEEGV